MPVILVLCAGREGRSVVGEQLAGLRAEVRYVETRSELRNAAEAPDVTWAIVELFDRDGRPVTPVLHELSRDVPELKVVVSYEPSPGALDEILETLTYAPQVAFAARPYNHLGRFLGPLLALRSSRAPGAADSLVKQVVGHAETPGARRCLTFAAVNPAHRINVSTIARFCGTKERTLYRHLEFMAAPKLVISGLAWPQANYLLTALHWRVPQVAAFFGFRRPAPLIDLLVDYVESGLWKMGLDSAVDGVAALAAPPRATPPWLHRRRFRTGAGHNLTLTMGQSMGLEDVVWNAGRRQQLSGSILSLLDEGASPIEIVRRLWRRYDLAPGPLYRGVMQAVQTMRSNGLVEEARG